MPEPARPGRAAHAAMAALAAAMAITGRPLQSRPVTRWFRLLVLALLIPAYGLAAAGVALSLSTATVVDAALADAATTPAAVPQAGSALLMEGHAHPALFISGHDDADVLSLIFELGDTSDDMPELGWPQMPRVPSTPAQFTLSPWLSSPAPSAWQPSLLRPPSPRG